MQKFAEIVARVEQIRQHFGMNKSRFATKIGMKAQTYNNFIGSQGSKPNVELLHSIVDHFDVHPMWLLTGQGEMFVFESQNGATDRVASYGHLKSVATSESTRAAKTISHQHDFASISQLLVSLEELIAQTQSERMAVVDRVSRALATYLARCPREAGEELSALLERIESRLSGKNGQPHN